jgi:hypothetical protein
MSQRGRNRRQQTDRDRGDGENVRGEEASEKREEVGKTEQQRGDE